MNKPTLAEIMQAIEKIDDLRIKELERQASLVREAYILPLCRRKKWKYRTSNGTWVFFGGGEVVADSKIPKKLLDILAYDWLAIHINDVDEKDW